MSKIVGFFYPWSTFGLAILAVLVQQTTTIAQFSTPLSEKKNSQLPSVFGKDVQLLSSPLPISPHHNSPIQALPEDVNPNANPLLFPTQPQEVEIEKVQSISLEQAIQLALRNNKTLQAARVNLEAARAGLTEAEAALYPSFGTNFGFTGSDPIGAIQGERLSGSTLSVERFQVDGNIELRYDIYAGGGRAASIRRAEQEIRFNQLEIERTSQQIRFEVTQQYLELQRADSNVAIAQASIEDASQTLRDAQLLREALLGTKFQVLQAETSLAFANEDLTQAIAQQRIARRQLAETLSLGQQVELTAGDEIKEKGTWDLSLEESIVLAYKNRAELEQQLIQEEISEQDRQIALAQITPTVSLLAEYDYLYQFNGNEITLRFLNRGNVGYVDGYTFKAQVEWNFFDGGRAWAQAEVAERNRESAQIEFANQRNQIRLQVETAYYNYLASKDLIKSTFINLQTATEQLRLARLSYQAGVVNQLDVVDAQQVLTTARGRYLQAVISYNQALNGLQRAISNLPESRLFQFN